MKRHLSSTFGYQPPAVNSRAAAACCCCCFLRPFCSISAGNSSTAGGHSEDGEGVSHRGKMATGRRLWEEKLLVHGWLTEASDGSQAAQVCRCSRSASFQAESRRVCAGPPPAPTTAGGTSLILTQGRVSNVCSDRKRRPAYRPPLRLKQLSDSPGFLFLPWTVSRLLCRYLDFLSRLSSTVSGPDSLFGPPLESALKSKSFDGREQLRERSGCGASECRFQDERRLGLLFPRVN